MKKNNFILNLGMFGVIISLGYILFVLMFGHGGLEDFGNMIFTFFATMVSAILIAIGIFIEKKK